MEQASSHQKRKPFGKQLEPHYYLKHFEKIISIYNRTYKKGFCEELDEFIELFNSLSFEAKCILVRSANRKKTFFSSKDFEKYSEIPFHDAAFDELIDLNLFSTPASSDWRSFTSQATKFELQKILESSGVLFKKSLSKSALLDLVQKCRPSSLIHVKDVYKFNFVDKYKLLLFSYFGTLSMDLSTFALKDMGLRQTGKFKPHQTARYKTEKSLKTDYFYSDLYKKTKEFTAETVGELLNHHPIGMWPQPKNSKALLKYNKILLELSKKKGLQKQQIISILERAISTPARMALARAYWKFEKPSHCKSLLKNIIDSPSDDEELLEAQDFLSIKFGDKKRNSMTDLLNSSETLVVDEAFRDSVEYGIMKKYKEKGYHVVQAENDMWRSLFGLVFWEELYGSKATSIFNEFDRLPASLALNTFSNDYAQQIEAKVETLFSEASKKRLLKVFTENYGKKNAVFKWKKNCLYNLFSLIDTRHQGIKSILQKMSDNFNLNRSGYPDLALFKDGKIKLVEVKGEGDSIRRSQMVRITQLKKEGFDAKIVRAKFEVDPAQTYVVVDVETTGGRSSSHRITEIGAVKIRDGKEIDSFQTLLNPERSIPLNITKLTGITNKMVAGAPLFSEIADDFRDFCGDAIFTAHHVVFDYGFIKSEFERIGQPFRLPKFCTCAQARKHLKGPKRYGLAVISEYYGIELESHHRALCDARAASQILLLINEKRLRDQRNSEIKSQI